MKKYMFELKEGQEFILPILGKELGVEFTEVEIKEFTPAMRRLYRRYRYSNQEVHPHKTYMTVGDYYHVFFDGPCEDAQALKVATSARWDGIHGYWYTRVSEGTEKWLKDNGYTMMEQ